mgnify:CR=1 FL=1
MPDISKIITEIYKANNSDIKILLADLSNINIQIEIYKDLSFKCKNIKSKSNPIMVIEIDKNKRRIKCQKLKLN